VCFVAGGLAFVVAFAQFIVASTGADATGPAEPLPMALGYTFLAGLLLVGGVSQRRRSRRSHEALLTRVAAGRDRYHCRCGKPKYPYFWLHGLLCIVFPYGLLALLFPLKKCRGCGVEYDAAGEAG
jgi:hypothetical protein